MDLHQSFGIGDAAHYAFRPLVWFIDLIWGTDLMQCEKCKRRRSRWNSRFAVPRWMALLAVTLLAVIATLLTW